MFAQERHVYPMNFAGMQELNAVFAEVKSRFDEQRQQGLVCKQGLYKDCCVLKLQKACWTNDSMKNIANQSGIFFSVWSTKESLQENRVMYNIHALKLRQLKNYTIAAGILPMISGSILPLDAATGPTCVPTMARRH